MKNIFVIIASLLLVFMLQTPLLAFHNNGPVVVYAPSSSIVNADIIQALQDADANKISRYFSDMVDIKLPQKDEMRNMSRSQASITLKAFFDEEKISGFNLTSQRELGATKYIAGKLQGSKEYNITLMIKESDGKDSIITIRIN